MGRGCLPKTPTPGEKKNFREKYVQIEGRWVSAESTAMVGTSTSTEMDVWILVA